MSTITAWALLLLNTLAPFTIHSMNGTATWYGNDFIGKHHAAYWHEQTPEFAPDVVDYNYLGVAAPDYIPFGTKLLIIRESTCMSHPSEYDGKAVVATVVDRKANHKVPHYFDLWPATAKELGFGPAFKNDAGCITVIVIQLFP